ncbi:30S ribosomal protein S9 [Patescibacteria group bacterium]|nr:30S ribosomal protein S9 [Patescibacteria group bacterium]MBU1890876.1 30S ribosomal protein S9 [Patescibacteria group bacterium]
MPKTKPKTTTKKTAKPKVTVAKSRKRGRPKKSEAVETVKKVVVEKQKTKRLTYLYSVGRRKRAIARGRYYKKGEGKFLVNNKTVDEYFNSLELQNIARSPLKTLGLKLDGDISMRVLGGGKKGQADSVCLSLARLLLLLDISHRPQLKKSGLLKSDARVKERKKYGLKRARRAPQWRKR